MASTQHDRSVDGIEVAPEPFGAKATDPDPRLVWREDKATLGGFNPPVRFSDGQAEIINAIADTLIPAANTFPAPSEIEIVDFFGRYVTPEDRPLKYFPLAGERDFKARLDGLGQAFVDASSDERVETLRGLEQGDEDDQAFFAQLRALSYYGYYARPEVTLAIQRTSDAAGDYHGPPQPYGYLGKVEPWPEGAFDNPVGGYLATEAIERIDIPDDIKAEYGVS